METQNERLTKYTYIPIFVDNDFRVFRSFIELQ